MPAGQRQLVTIQLATIDLPCGPTSRAAAG